MLFTDRLVLQCQCFFSVYFYACTVGEVDLFGCLAAFYCSTCAIIDRPTSSLAGTCVLQIRRRVFCIVSNCTALVGLNTAFMCISQRSAWIRWALRYYSCSCSAVTTWMASWLQLFPSRFHICVRPCSMKRYCVKGAACQPITPVLYWGELSVSGMQWSANTCH